jgi:hypothetical protein
MVNELKEQAPGLCEPDLSASGVCELSMADFPQLDYTKGQVERAGNALKGAVIWSQERRVEILEIFAIANSWRDSHAYPMHQLRQELALTMRKRKLAGITVARLKRMDSIRRKLATMDANLQQMQDLGGVRAILPSIADVNTLVKFYEENPKHDFHNAKNYIERPKAGGYRCHHLIYKFRDESAKQPYKGRRIEIQIRTRLQHSWATAVEAIGMFRREDMKGGSGDQDWLRFFDLMSAELALAERCPEAKHLPPHRERAAEIRELDSKLKALSTLENLRQAIRFAGSYKTGIDNPTFYRIEYNNETREVRVKPHAKPITAISENEAAEQKNTVAGRSKINTVFIEADRIEDLVAGYPNYFGDVHLFSRNLQSIISGQVAKEYTMPPQETIPRPPKEVPDLSWFRRPRRRWS